MSNVKTVLITGAGTGIGRGIAIAFASQGMNLALLGRTRRTLEETAQACETEPLIFEASVDDRERLAEVVSEIETQRGPIHILVNNAGMNTKLRNLSDMPPEEWDRVIEVNLTGVAPYLISVDPERKLAIGNAILALFFDSHRVSVPLSHL